MMWNAVKKIESRGGEVRMNTGVVGIHRNGNGIESVAVGVQRAHKEIKAGPTSEIRDCDDGASTILPVFMKTKSC